MNNDVAASGGVPGAAIFVSVFFIKIGFVAVGAEHDVRHPVRRSAHDGTWENNLFNFFMKVSPKLSADLKKPFVLDNQQRVDCGRYADS